MKNFASGDLGPLRDVIARHNIRTKKSLGQHFLHDLNLTARIASAAGPLDDRIVLEIGPGPGGLTRSILQAGARQVIAVETDRRCVAALNELAASFDGRLSVRQENALKLPDSFFADLRSAGKVRIIANLPYNISTPLLTMWLHREFENPTFESMTLMFQKEVADRLVSEPGSRSYGRLTVLTGWLMECRRVFDVAPEAFVPAPKVTSTVVELIPRMHRDPDVSIERLEDVTRAAFGQRRKMLRSSLKALPVNTDKLLEITGISGARRAETLSITEFCELARALDTLLSK